MSDLLHSAKRISLVAACGVLCIAFPGAPAEAGKSAKPTSQSAWPQFLGPDRTGISPETGLIDEWPADGPKVVWRVRGGVGMSGVAVADGRAITLVQKSGKQFALALDAKTGETLWETPLADAYENQMGDGPRATPAITSQHVFTFTGDGVLSALKPSDGSIEWTKNVFKEFGGKAAEYGMASSPLLVGDNVVVTPGAPGATVAAFEQATGRLSWKAGARDAAGYSSPAVLDVGGKKQVVAFDGGAVLGVDPDKGALLWRYPFVTDYNCNIATPLEFKGNVFISSGENHGCALLSLSPDGDGFKVKEVWEDVGTKSVMRNEWQTSILLNGYLYGFDNVGSAGPVTHLTCVDASTGKRKWQKLRFGKGNLISADGKLFITTMKGELVVVRVDPEKFDELGRAELIGTTRQAPALANGKLYLRDGREIVCVDVQK